MDQRIRVTLERVVGVAVLLVVAFVNSKALAQSGRTPINDLGSGLYLGEYQGGLYPGGSNAMPAAHSSIGLTKAAAVQPRDPAGNLDANGKYVLLSIGMSNTTQEFSAFMVQAASHPLVNHTTLAIVDGAAGGQSAATWDSPTDVNYNRVRDNVLAPKGLSEAQVQAAWVKVANPNPGISLPSADADAWRLVRQMGDISRALAVRYPNLETVFFSSRIYAGYATGTLNPEPYAYESGFVVKWLVEAQIEQMSGGGIDSQAGDLNYSDGTAPWVAWGPYLWADGLNPRSDGLIWERSDLATDGTHPSNAGRQKVGTMLMDFMLTSPHSQPWFSTVPEPSSALLVLAAGALLLRRHGIGGEGERACTPNRHTTFR